MQVDVLSRVRDQFSRQQIHREGKNDPKVFFNVTDFISPVQYTEIEDIATCMVDGVSIAEADMIVSIADRSSGCIAHEVALRTGLPYTLANWYPVGSVGEVEVEPCKGFSGNGSIFLNGLKRNKKIVIVMDVMRTGATAGNLIAACYKAGCTVQSLVVAAELLEYEGRTNPLLHGIEVKALVSIHMRGERTKEAKDSEFAMYLTATSNTGSAPSSPEKNANEPQFKEALTVEKIIAATDLNQVRVTTEAERKIRALKRMDPERHAELFKIVEAGFLGVPIMNNPKLSYPYSFFQLTDFTPAMPAAIVEAMADLCVQAGDFERCDLIVSEADRGGAPLAQAVARRTHKPFVLANWYSIADGVGAATQSNVGFSGDGLIVVNGVKPGDRCIFVDDMLSSGGTAEGVITSIQKLGGITVEGVFVSEKLYPGRSASSLPIRKGKDRLKKTFPDVDITTLVQFVAEGDRTSAPQGRIG